MKHIKIGMKVTFLGHEGTVVAIRYRSSEKTLFYDVEITKPAQRAGSTKTVRLDKIRRAVCQKK